jgi:hypothetical protein
MIPMSSPTAGSSRARSVGAGRRPFDQQAVLAVALATERAVFASSSSLLSGTTRDSYEWAAGWPRRFRFDPAELEPTSGSRSSSRVAGRSATELLSCDQTSHLPAVVGTSIAAAFGHNQPPHHARDTCAEVKASLGHRTRRAPPIRQRQDGGACFASVSGDRLAAAGARYGRTRGAPAPLHRRSLRHEIARAGWRATAHSTVVRSRARRRLYCGASCRTKGAIRWQRPGPTRAPMPRGRCR